MAVRFIYFYDICRTQAAVQQSERALLHSPCTVISYLQLRAAAQQLEQALLHSPCTVIAKARNLFVEISVYNIFPPKDFLPKFLFGKYKI